MVETIWYLLFLFTKYILTKTLEREFHFAEMTSFFVLNISIFLSKYVQKGSLFSISLAYCNISFLFTYSILLIFIHLTES